MHPILFSLEPFTLFGSEWGPFTLHSYGALIALSFALCLWVGIRLGRQEAIPATTIFDAAFWSLLAGIVGSRLLFSVIHARDYWNACFSPELPNPLNNGLPLSAPNCWAAVNPWGGGLVWYGGLIGALLAGWLYLRLKKLPVAAMLDIGLGAAPLGHAVGRLGCLMAGCCWGRPTDAWVGLRFPDTALPYVGHAVNANGFPPLPLHPTQLYEAVGELAIFWALLILRRYRRFHGQVALGFLILYPLLRATVEFFRGDAARGLLVSWTQTVSVGGQTVVVSVGFSIGQLISLLVALAALGWMAHRMRGRTASL